MITPSSNCKALRCKSLISSTLYVRGSIQGLDQIWAARAGLADEHDVPGGDDGRRLEAAEPLIKSNPREIKSNPRRRIGLLPARSPALTPGPGEPSLEDSSRQRRVSDAA